MDDHTRMFEPFREDKSELRAALTAVHAALNEKGYNPVVQIVGYLLSGDPAYITAHRGARALIRGFERDEILEDLVRHYLSD